MQVIGVIDVRSGVAVHARGGRRELYEPVRGALVSPERAGDPAALARGYRDLLGLAEIYVADLDAISGQSAQDLSEIRSCGLAFMVDAGITTEVAADLALVQGAARVVVGLETLESFAHLRRIVQHAGSERVVFSLDLCDAQPMTRPGAPFSGVPPIALACQAVECGASAVILLDLGRVGRSVGVDMALVEAVRAELGAVELLVGGGIRHRADLERLTDTGCDGALVGTALHDGLVPLDLPHAQ